MNEVIIYQKGTTKVYIHKGRIEKNHKLPWYGIRRDDDTGLAHLLGIISFSGRWRQFVTVFEPNTQWNAGCKEKIAMFERKLNLEWRKSLRKC